MPSVSSSRASLGRAACVALALLAGCATRPPPRPTIARAVSLDFAVETQPQAALVVTLSFDGSPTGETQIALHERYLGQKTNAAFLGLTVVGRSGAPLPIGKPAAHRLTVSHAPGEPLTVRYRITPRPERVMSGSFVRPVVASSLVYLVGESGLLLPSHFGDGAIEVRQTWRGLPAGWRAVSSLGSNATETRTGTIDVLRHAVFLAGPLRTVEQQVANGKLVLATMGQWRFTDAMLLDLTRQIVDGQHTYTQGNKPPYFLVVLLPVDAPRRTRPAIAGQSPSNGIVLFAQPTLDVGHASDFRRLRRVLALYAFRQWSGLAPDADPISVWISEGFSSMLSRRLLYRAGLYSVEEYAADLNGSLRHYFLNPWRDLPDAQRTDAHLASEEYALAVQARGELLALLVDIEMRRRSEGRQSLDDVMHDLVVEGKRSGQPFSVELLAGRLGELVGSSFAQQIRDVAANSGMTGLPRDTLFPCLRQSVTLRGPWKLGFDFDASDRAHKIVGVEPNGPAWQAGLRDGLPLVGARIDFDNPGEEVRIQIKDGNDSREVRYLPQGQPRSLPQLSVNDPNRCSML